MSYLKFDRRLMANLDESTQREYIRTNRKGRLLLLQHRRL